MKIRRKIGTLAAAAGLVFAALMFLIPGAALALESLCATVKIEIAQELTLERQAFDAHMRINNGLTTMPIENVAVTVNFADKVGNWDSN